MSHGVATPPLLPALTVYYREVPLLVFRLGWYLVRCSVAFALVARTVPVPVLVIALSWVAGVVAFSPILRISR